MVYRATRFLRFNRWRKFDIDYLKIDQSFVRNLSGDEDDVALCEVITEGVEAG